jgi:hypothetical protein
LETVYFEESVVSGYFFGLVIINMCVLLQHSINYRKAAVNSYLAMVGATPYCLFLKVPWVYMRLASSDFIRLLVLRSMNREGVGSS